MTSASAPVRILTAAIEDAVVRLADSPELRRCLGQAAQQTMSRYTWERSALMLEKLFQQVIASEGQTSE